MAGIKERHTEPSSGAAARAISEGHTELVKSRLSSIDITVSSILRRIVADICDAAGGWIDTRFALF
jgi:hypothetical protein